MDGAEAEHAWTALEHLAWWSLEHAGELPPQDAVAGMGTQLRVWHHPAAGPWMSWTVILGVGPVSNEKRPVVRQVAWDRAGDRARIDALWPELYRAKAIPPCVVVRDAELSWSALQPFMDEATRLSGPLPSGGKEPPRPQRRSGIEGYRSMAYLRVEWCDDGPAEWRGVIAWVLRLQRLLATTIEERASG
jgi:hypothetical protein